MKLLKRILSFLLLLVVILSLVGLAALGLVTLTVLCSPVIAVIVLMLCGLLAWDASASSTDHNRAKRDGAARPH